MSHSKNVLIVGATAGAGLFTVHHLLKTEHTVSVVVRNPKKLDAKFGADVAKFRKVCALDLEGVAREW